MDDCVKKRITQSRGVTHGYLISEVSPKAKVLLTFVKFIYSEKATKFCEIFTLLLTGHT